MGRNFALLTPQIAEAVKLYAEGVSMNKLADIYEVSPNAVRNALVLSGVEIRDHAQAGQFFVLDLEKIRRLCKINEQGCWIWHGKPGVQGFAVTSHKNKTVYVHRLTYELSTGKRIPRKKVVLQSCYQKLCCNPDHLELANRTEAMASYREIKFRNLTHQKGTTCNLLPPPQPM